MKKLIPLVCLMSFIGGTYADYRSPVDSMEKDRRTVIVYVCPEDDQFINQHRDHPGFYVQRSDHYFKAALMASGITATVGIIAAIVMVKVMDK